MDSPKFIVCRASAGAGKTYTLVRHYLELAFDSEDVPLERRFKQILAITFTNKAVNEMKSRILDYLQKIEHKGAEEQMCQDLMGIMQLDETEIRRRAHKVHYSILHNYSDFSVCTIDSFIQGIVKTFAYDLELPMNFDISTDPKKVAEDTVEQLMSLCGQAGESDLDKVLLEFAQSQMDDSKSFYIDNELKEMAESLLNEDAAIHLKELEKINSQQFIDIFNACKNEYYRITDHIKELGKRARTTWEAEGLEAGDFANGASGAPSYFKKFEDGKNEDATPTALKFLNGNALGKSGCPEETTDAISRVKQTLIEIYKEIEQCRKDELPKANTYKMVMDQLYKIALMNRLYGVLDDYYHEQGMLHISEMNKRIQQVVQEEQVPFIYERIGTRYTNFLIDEFQDTSHMQWHNLIPLLENALANGERTLIVGDGKQAIYRFRQGDAHQFAILPKVDKSIHGGSLQHYYEEVPLQQNFRTRSEIVNFNNEFFEWAVQQHTGNEEMRQVYLGTDYESRRAADPDAKPQLYQIPVKTKHPGMVKLAFHDSKDDEQPWKLLAQEIVHQVEDLGYHYSDIVILGRSKGHLTAASTYMAEHYPQIALASDESFLLDNSTSVMLVRELMGLLSGDTDPSTRGRVLMYLTSLGILGENSLQDFVAAKMSLGEFLKLKGFEFDTEQLRNMDLYNCCESLIRCFGLDKIDCAYCASMLNTVSSYSLKYRQNLKDFCQWFDDQIAKKKLVCTSAVTEDAVQLMTIHKAKGLEGKIILYPLRPDSDHDIELWADLQGTGVALPTCCVKFPKNDKTLLDDAREEEIKLRQLDEFNILYVAMTRPKEKLVVFAPNPETPVEEKKKSNTKVPDPLSHACLLHNFVKEKFAEQQAIVPKTPWIKEEKDSTEFYLLGEDAKFIPDDKNEDDEPEKLEISTLSYPLWKERIAVAVQKTPTATSTDLRIQEGLRTHEILATVHDRASAHDDVARYAALHNLTDEETKILQQRIYMIVDDSACSQFFAPGLTVKNECPLYFNHEERRPDRIVFTDQATYVVDFKTGQPSEKYYDQVRKYCEAIDAMGIYPKARGFLLYIGKDIRVEEVAN